MAFNYPYGDTQQLNLNWFLAQWETFREQWATAEEGIDHALDAEIARVEAAMTDLYAARDAAAASKTAAQTAATNAASSETVATQQATLAQSYANTAQTQAGIATAAAEAAGNSASSASTSAAAANLSKTQAANSATAAQTAQTAAEASATAAAGSASDAADSATAAAGSATAAAGSATAAAGSATAAAGSASSAADSATAAAASAASIVVDSAMSDSSTNPVQNKVINGEITELKTAITYIENGYEVISFDTVDNEYPNASGGFSTQSGWKRSDYIPVTAGESIFVYNPSYATSDNAFYKSDKTIIKRFQIAIGSPTEITIPENCAYIVISNYKNQFFDDVYRNVQVLATKEDTRPIRTLLYDVKDLMSAVNLSEDNLNLFDYNTVDTSKLTVSGTTQIVNASITSAVYIPILPNSIVHVTAAFNTNRFVVATTSKEPADGVAINQVFNFNSTNTRDVTFVTGENDKYIFVVFYSSSSSSPITEAEAKQSISIVYGTHSGNALTTRLDTPNIASMLMLNNQMVNLLCNRQLGTLKKGYICLSADDGDEQLALYTLPTLHDYADSYQKPIPLTMGLAGYTSPAFPVLDNQTYIDIVKNALDNYGCSIGTHGNIMFTNYTRQQFYDYLTKQDANIYEITGHHPTSVLYVSHGLSNDVMFIAGSFYGVCGSIPSSTGGTADKWGNNSRANMYAMKRFSLLSNNINDSAIEAAVDYALANNEILCPYWHDVNFGTESEGVVSGATAKARFEHFIEYCMSKNADFINFGDIPTLEVNT